MSAEEALRASERSAATTGPDMENQVFSRVNGKTSNNKYQMVLNGIKNHKSFGALGLITLIFIFLIVLISSGSLIPAAILERLVEATDVQYADAVESKLLVFQQALETESVPENTVARLELNEIKVEGSSIVFDGQVIAAENFIDAIHGDARLYKAFNNATYNRAAYYYDESAEAVFKKIGTNRNNYTASSSFDAVMSGLVGEGSDVKVNNVGLFEREDEEGNKYTEYDTVGENASSGEGAEGFISRVAENNLAENSFSATLNATDALNTADTISKEQKSSIFFMALMENISKMKAGQGNNAKINEAMNFLYKEQDSSVLDVDSGEMVTVHGSMLEAPSLYAILAGSKIDTSKVKNYASDRILGTIENKIGVESIGTEAKTGNVTSTSNKIKGTIGRFLPEMGEMADAGVLGLVAPTINSSLVDNGFNSIGGIYGGEVLVEGAVNVGKELAKASGATAGDAGAVLSYSRVSDKILALDAEVDRMNRSPFDITSKNTFLGSIVYKLGVNMPNQPFLKIIGIMASGIIPSTHAEDEGTNYLNNFGKCETLKYIGAVGSALCSEIATFDTSTLNGTFHDEGFLAFVEENTTLSENGSRTINKNSKLADFIKYNDERITPLGVMDGGILESIKRGSIKLPFVSNIIAMIKTFLESSDADKNLATGKSFVNSSSNPDWETYKYAQRYVSLARATDALRQYDGDETAYNSLKGFEGSENPVVAFIRDYYQDIASSN